MSKKPEDEIIDIEEEDEIISSNIIQGDLNDHMSSSYLDYAYSVIVGRALPDVRDGLKPVHRRIIYSCYKNKFHYNTPHKKCARIVGDVLGKYHPHGDTSVYFALVRMAQDFSMRYPLIDKQGNFGSVDGDPPAAMRYTEARLDRISEELISDIEKETVDFVPNFDESLEEPVFLPAKIPTLLMNGSNGIAVGMRTNMPPYNLNEIIEAINAVIAKPDMFPEEINDYIKGPDFPTGGILVGRKGIRHIINTGRGKLTIRGCTEIEEKKKHLQLIITEIPYQVNKAKLVESIANLINNKKITGITDLRDESSRKGIRIVIELKSDSDPNAIKYQLFNKTNLQTSMSVINLVLVQKGKRPYVLNIMGLIKQFIDCREDTIIKRTEFDLKNAKKRLHIIEGLLIAIDNIDDVITIIKASKDSNEAKNQLIKIFKLTDEQTSEILNMPLRRLTGLQQQKLIDEKAQIEKNIKSYEEILGNKDKRMEIIKEELNELQKKYGDERRTEILDVEEDVSDDAEILKAIPDENCVVMLTKNQYIKRMRLIDYQSQHRGGKGKKGINKREEDIIKDVFILSSHDKLLLFTEKGRVYSKFAYEIPIMSRTSRGKALVNFVGLKPGEQIVHIIPVSEFIPTTSLIFCTKFGIVKKTPLKDFKKVRKTGVHALKLKPNDELLNVELNEGDNYILIATKNGFASKFSELELRPLGRTAMGVRGIKLRENDEVVDMIIGDEDTEIITITNKGYGKRSKLELYRQTRRGGKGVINIKFRDPKDSVNSVNTATDEDILIATTSGIIIRVPSVSLRSLSRSAKGVRVIKLNDDDLVSSVAICLEEGD
ncbi:MAG: DNA gyrase subunit A [archaeon]|nr:DNA gyrase subunit A [archaeon]